MSSWLEREWLERHVAKGMSSWLERSEREVLARPIGRGTEWLEREWIEEGSRQADLIAVKPI